ncbi:MAG: hypothetical protein ACAF41_14215 [Leptolyngbya sp. BL-A-14]
MTITVTTVRAIAHPHALLQRQISYESAHPLAEQAYNQVERSLR